MAVWSDSTFVNINSGGNYATVGISGDTWIPATPAGIQENYGFGVVMSTRTTTASTGDQYVKITTPDATKEWFLGLRQSSTAAADVWANGYVIRQAGGFVWYHSGTSSSLAAHAVTIPGGTVSIEARAVGTLVTVYFNGSAVDSFNFSGTPKTGQYAGIGAGNSAVVVTAEGGDVGGAATVPAQVTGLVATGGVGTKIDLTWDVPDNGGAVISGYRIRRAPDVAGAAGTFTTLVANTGSFTAAYSDTGLTLGAKWWYAVAAINSVGTGTESTSATATVANPPPPAFTEDFSAGLKNWTIARWRSEQSLATPANAGYVPPSSNDDGHYDGVAGTHTTPTGAGILPPYDIFVGSNNWLYVGGGSQNYGDTHLRCAQQMDLTGSGPWKIRLGFVPNPNGTVTGGYGLMGWSTLYATDKPMASPSMEGENSHGPVPLSGFAVRLDYNNFSDGTNVHPAPMVVTYNNRVEATDMDNAHGIATITTTAIVEVVLTFTRTNMRITADGVVWYDKPWTIPSALTSAWLYLGAHNHATRKYPPYPDSRSAIYSHFEFDGPVIAPQYSYSVADSLNPVSGVGEDTPVPGVEVGWHSPTGPLIIPNVPANVSSAQLVMSSKWVHNTPNSNNYYVRYSLNGNATHDEQTDYQCTAGPFNYAFHVNPAELVQGDNTLNISLIGQVGSYAPSVGNISLLVEAFSVGQIAVGSTILPKLAIGDTDIKLLAVGSLEIWRAPLPPRVPTFPTLITLLQGASGQLVARWSQPVDNGAALSDYTIQYRVSPSGTWTAFTHSAAWARTATITGLSAVAYDVRVAAVNSVGTGGWSNMLTATPTGPPTVPFAPVLSAAAGNAQVVLGWTAPANGGSAITNYLVETSANGTSGWSTVTTINALTYTHTGRTNGTIYYYRVSAINTVGTGSPSNVANATPTSAVVYSDNFNRANNSTLGSPWVTVDAAIPLASNKATASTAGGTSMKYNQTFSNDQWAEADMVCVPGSSGNSLGPAVRLGAAGGGAYFANYDASTQNIDVYRRDGSGNYAEAVAPYSTTGLAGTFKCRVEAQGTTIRMYINDVLRGTGTDSTVASGLPGLWGAQYGATATADNFRCGNLPYTP